jgi:sugar phosphate permease
MKVRPEAKKAIMIGSLCSVSYFAVYIARNILGAVTPFMTLEEGITEAYIGNISAMFLLFYACGQLINGFIGDRIKAKWMISLGLLGAGLVNAVFPFIAKQYTVAPIVYSMAGFFLSMIYGPMTKVVSENTEPIYATRCSLGYTFASFFGSPAAGLIAAFLTWKIAFGVSSAVLFLMSAMVMVFFTVFEKKGVVKYGQYKTKEKGIRNVKILFQHQIVKFSLVAILTGVVRTSVVFWLPTYISQHLDFPETTAVTIFSAATLAISFTTFIAIFVYERIGRDMDKTVLIMFASSVVFFALTYFVQAKLPNIICIVLAIMSSNGAATMLWSRYCPSLRDTGMVSSATGFLDFLSYTAAAAANIIFPKAVDAIGWGNLILVWMGIVLVGVVIALPYSKIKPHPASKNT